MPNGTYGGVRGRRKSSLLDLLLVKIGISKSPMKLELITGDSITPREIEHTYPCILAKKI